MKLFKRIRGVLFILAAGVLWGHTGLFVHVLSGRGVSEMSISMMRLVFTFILMSIAILVFDRSLFKVKLRVLPYFILTGVIGMVGSSLFYFYSIELTSMSVAAVLMYTSPTIVMLLSLIVFRDKLTWRRAICCVIGFLGAALSTGVLTGNSNYSLLGIMFGALAGFSYALYSVGSALAMRHGCNTITISLYSFAFAAATIMIVGDVPALVANVASDPVIIPISIAQSVFTCLLPYVLYTLGIMHTGPSNASIMSTIELVVASLLGLFVFGETIMPSGYVGIVLVITSIVLLNINLPHRHKTKGSG